MVTITKKNLNKSSTTTTTNKEPRPPTWKVWLVASRPHTLTAAIAPCLVGWAVVTTTTTTDNTGDAKLSLTNITFLWTLFCILVQLGTNLHNDYADFVKGADTDARVGQSRATQKGWLTPAETARGATTVLTGCLFVGVYFLQQIRLANQQEGESEVIDGLFLFVVLSSIFNAFAYTGGPYPLGYIGLGNFSIGYSGLGDIFVFIYFGCVATIAIPYLYDRTSPNTTVTSSSSSLDCLKRILFTTEAKQPTTLMLAAISVGLMATNILVVNNLRDRHTDVYANKRTLAVRLGGTFCRIQYTVQTVAAYALVLLDCVYMLKEKQLLGEELPKQILHWRLLPLLSIPFARQQIFAIWKTDGAELNKHVGKTALLELFFCILLSIGLVKSSTAS